MFCSRMARPRANRLGNLECDELLRAVQACRSACVLALSKAPIDAEGVAVVRELLAVMDRLADLAYGRLTPAANWAVVGRPYSGVAASLHSQPTSTDPRTSVLWARRKAGSSQLIGEPREDGENLHGRGAG